MIISLDMDGILANFVKAAADRANKLWNINLSEKDFKGYDTRTVISNAISAKRERDSVYPAVTWKNICPPGFFSILKPYPNMWKTVKTLSEMGELLIVTKPLEWRYSPSEKVNWLKNYLTDIEYKIIMVDRPEQKGLIKTDIIVDDDPRVIRSLSTDTTGIMIARPWNMQYIQDYLPRFVSRLSDLPNYIKSIYF